MAQWAVSIPADIWASERLFQHDAVSVPGNGPAAGDDVLLVAGEPPRAVALGTVTEARDDTLLVKESYARGLAKALPGLSPDGSATFVMGTPDAATSSQGLAAYHQQDRYGFTRQATVKAAAPIPERWTSWALPPSGRTCSPPADSTIASPPTATSLTPRS